MFRNAVFMGLTTGVRLLTGVLLFILIARAYGPSEFGLFMFWMTLTTILALLVDYGFILQVLREVGHSPTRANHIMGEVLVTKLCLTVVLIIFAVIASMVMDNLSLLDKAMFLLLLLAAILFSFGDFICAPFRAKDAFQEETKVIVVANVLHFLLVVGLIAYGADIIVIAIAFVVARLIYVLFALRVYKQVIGNFEFPQNLRLTIGSRLKTGFSYAIDLGLLNVYMQIDTVLIKYYLGSYAVGIYQSGAKLVQGYFALAQVLNNLYIPKIANQSGKSNDIASVFNRLLFQSIFIGTLGYFFFSVLLIEVMPRVLGSNYSELNYLYPYFGLMVFVKYLAGAFGIVLAGIGFQKVRVNASIISLIVLLLLSAALIPRYEIRGILIAIVIATLVTMAIYIAKLLKSSYQFKLKKYSWITLLLSVLIISLHFIESVIT